MAIATYSGRLSDFAEEPFPSASPRLFVLAERDAFGPTGALSRRQIPVAVNALGEFSFDVVPSADTAPPTRYRLICEWLDVDQAVIGWSEWAFTAAVGGGPISEMGLIPITRFWCGPTEPPNRGPGLWWLDTSDYPYLMKEWVE